MPRKPKQIRRKKTPLADKVKVGERNLEVGKATLAALLTASTKTEAAKILGISRKGLYKRIERFKLLDYLDIYYDDAAEVLTKGAVKAAKNFVKKIDSTKEDVSMNASAEVLERIGLTKKRDVKDGSNIQINIANVLDKQKGEFRLDE